MSRIALFLLSVFATFFLTLAVPVPVANGELVHLEKRIDHYGRGTWFHPGLGNCGQWNNDSDMILAIGKGLYDRNGGSNCGQWVHIVNTANGKTAYGMTRDSCQSCGDNDIDMSPALFQQLSPLGTGVLRVKWNFMNRNWHP